MRFLKQTLALLMVFFMSVNIGMFQVSAASEYEETASVIEENGTITEFLDTDPIYKSYSNRPEEDTILSGLPETLDVYLDGSYISTEIPVTWECQGDYENTDDYYYQYNPVWDTSVYGTADQIEVPYAGVFVENKSGIKSFATVNTNETTIYKYLTETMGLNTAAACGILANIKSESNFSPTATGDNGTSYGICQWHNSRWTAMKNYCSKNGYSSSSLNGQLHYLQYELEKSYTSVLNYIKGVSNNAQGAYNAAYRWCYYYEIPANRASVSVTRGNLAKNTYWPRYAENAVDGSDLNTVTKNGITITGASTPGNLTEGSGFTIKGTISSTSKLTSVTVGAYNSSGTMKIGKTVTPNATSYDLAKVDNDILFGNLTAGTYTYKVIAKTASQNVTLISQSFTVQSKISISNASKPGTMAAGSSFTVTGTVASTVGKLSSVTVGVYTSSGMQQIGKTANPNTTTYNLSKVDNEIVFGKLAAGTYTYKVIAKTSSTTKTLVTKEFKVNPKKAKLSSLKVASGKKLTVKWIKDTAVTGYEIQYATSSNFSGAKTVSVNSYKTVSKQLTSLKKGAKYYVRVRSYKKVNGTKYYGEWSSSKLSAKIK